MAKKATPAKPAAKRKPAANAKTSAAARKPSRSAEPPKRRRSAPGRRKGDQTDFNAADALFKLIESPLVADLLAVGATAALAAIAESRFNRSGDGTRRSSKAMKAAATAAAAAMGRRLTTEFEEIRKASKKAKAPEAK